MVTSTFNDSCIFVIHCSRAQDVHLIELRFKCLQFGNAPRQGITFASVYRPSRLAVDSSSCCRYLIFAFTKTALVSYCYSERAWHKRGITFSFHQTYECAGDKVNPWGIEGIY